MLQTERAWVTCAESVLQGRFQNGGSLGKGAILKSAQDLVLFRILCTLNLSWRFYQQFSTLVGLKLE